MEPLLDRSAVSSVNLSEILQKGLAADADVGGLKQDLEALGLEIVGFTAEDAELAARLWPQSSSLGLSLADRCCLATAKRLEVPALTADRHWLEIKDDALTIENIR